MSALSKEIAPAPTRPDRGQAAGGGQTPRGGRMREVDGYRALAALMIIIFHAWTVGNQPYQGTPFETFVRTSAAGVSLFFALSGMVTFLPMVRGALAGNAPSGRSFLARRFLRILPLYYLIVIVVWASRYAGTPSDFIDLARHLSFTQVYDKQQIFWLLGPSWSLADEMHYYLLIALLGPVLARAAARRATVRARLAVMSLLPIALLLSSLAYTTIVSYALHVPAGDWWVYFNPLARADSFALGLLLAVVLCIPGARDERRRAAVALSAVGAAIMCALQLSAEHVGALSVFYYAIAGLGATFLLAGAAMLHERQWLSRFLRLKPFQFLATVGLSLYLLHEPVMIQLARWHILVFSDPVAWPISTVALIGASTIAAWVSYSLIERPAARLHKLWGDVRRRQLREPARRGGPPPRWLPDLTLQRVDGSPVALRELPRDRPVLFALAQSGANGLSEQRFRLVAGEADGFYVTSSQEHPAPAGTTVLVDRDERFAAALNGGPGLIEVSPGGLITAVLDAPRRPAEVTR
jgi:peptidoglycan/LPS O-acetylase OafA/YrhL